MGLGFGTRIWDSDIHRPSRRGRDGGGERAGRRRERQPEKAPMMEGGGERGRKRASKREREEGGRGTERERERDGGMEGGDARGTRGPPSPAHAGACSPRHGPGPTGPGPQPCGPRGVSTRRPRPHTRARVQACACARARAQSRRRPQYPSQTMRWPNHTLVRSCHDRGRRAMPWSASGRGGARRKGLPPSLLYVRDSDVPEGGPPSASLQFDSDTHRATQGLRWTGEAYPSPDSGVMHIRVPTRM